MNKKNVPFVIQVIQDIANISHVVNLHFKDEEKTTQWLNTGKPELAGKEPIELIFEARTDELRKFISESLEA